MLDRSLQFDVLDSEMEDLAALVEQRSGIVFAGARRQDFSLRVREYMATHRHKAPSDLLHALRLSPGEYDDLLERLLAAPTRFFQPRENFDAFQSRVLPEVHMRKFWDNPRSLRIWSAGCGAGEEAYSIALSTADAFDRRDAWNMHLVATDVSRAALQHAERGVYPRESLEALPAEQLDAWFARVGDLYMARPKLRHLVSFSRANLAEPVYLGRFDCIFCVHVLAYLRADSRSQLVQRFYECLEPGGYLFLAPDEELPDGARFQSASLGATHVFQKQAGGERRPNTRQGVLL